MLLLVVNKKTAVLAVFYFFVETNNAKIHPINDIPNNHDPTRTRILLYFADPLTAAK